MTTKHAHKTSLPLDCLLCKKHRGEPLVPGGARYADGLVYARHAHLLEGRPTQYLGWVTIETQRHVPGLAWLTDEEGAALGRLAAQLNRRMAGCAAPRPRPNRSVVCAHSIPAE